MAPINHVEPKSHHNPPPSPNREFLEVLILSSSDSDLNPEGVLSKSFLCRPPIPPTREAITIEPKGLLEGEISDGMLPSPRPNIEFETEQEIQTVGTSLKSKGNDSSIISA
eukprot:Gb_30468 [translate_table: standard]